MGNSGAIPKDAEFRISHDGNGSFVVERLERMEPGESGFPDGVILRWQQIGTFTYERFADEHIRKIVAAEQEAAPKYYTAKGVRI